jgi:hypothetical protein
MRTVTKEYKVYQFNELSEKAKEKARDWYRNGLEFDDEGVIEDCTEIGKLLGINISRIYYTGFSSQGDGACFDATYSYEPNAIKNIEGYSPIEKLLKFANNLEQIQKPHQGKLSANIDQVGHYYHSGCTIIDANHENEELGYSCYGNEAEELKEVLKDFMNWIYEQLEKAYEYQNSNETIEENIISNEYEFLENGSVFHG